MNLKFKELAEQAGSTHKQSLGVYQFYADELEKFANLIVQECATFLMDKMDDHFAAEQLKEHFEIEE